jgi:AraC-like DNA-binding protein
MAGSSAGSTNRSTCSEARRSTATTWRARSAFPCARLQSATKNVHGVSLRHYLRLKRLWSARRLLVSGSAGLSVTAAALATGFCHMGEFSRGYKSAFGEMPSETLEQGRHF